MSVVDFLNSDHKTAFSFEVLPPVRGKSIDLLYKSIDMLMPFNPSYINITTHRTDVVYRDAGNGMFRREFERTRPGTVAVAAALKGRYGIPSVPHVICSGFSRSELENELIDLSYLDITDILVLRGDRAKGVDRTPAEHDHAIDLCRQVNDFNDGLMLSGLQTEPLRHRFTYGVAGYPEKHEEAQNLDIDIENLKAKVDAGARYVVTQMFFDNRHYFSFVEKCRKAGIMVPVIPGLKPLSSLKQMTLLPKTFHIDLPMELTRELQKCKTNDDVKLLGIEWTAQQVKELKEANVPSIHFYSMNVAASIVEIGKKAF